MKVLVTGAAGYIGAHVARALEEAGHEVVRFDEIRSYLEVLVDATALGYNVVLLHPQRSISPFSTDASTIVDGRDRRIDIWWRGKQFNGDLMLLLTHLLTMNHEWNGATVTLRSIVLDESQKAKREVDLERLIAECGRLRLLGLDRRAADADPPVSSLPPNTMPRTSTHSPARLKTR